VSTKQRRIAELARAHPQRAFLALNHYLDYDWLYQAYRKTRKDGAPGIDGVTAAAYESCLQGNLAGLLERLQSGRSQAPAVRRAYVSKDDGTPRPLGIPTFEDKVAQRAMVMLLEPIYEQDFPDCSYGFRPGRSPHPALERLRNDITYRHGRWILDLDISNYFGTIDPRQLRAALDQRVKDGLVRKLIDKWLKAGVLEDGLRTVPDEGTPQGGVASPLLANVFLHHILDAWFHREVVPRLRGRRRRVRYADDVVCVFEHRDDAERVREVLGQRLAQYGLTRHPTKTHLVDFRVVSGREDSSGEPREHTFDFLGFTHVWKRSLRGTWAVFRQTAKKRLARSLRRVSDYCRRHRHAPLREQHQYLCRLLRGHYAYYGILGNSRGIASFAYQVRRLWHKWLKRRNGLRRLTWAQFNEMLRRLVLPAPRIVHTFGWTPLSKPATGGTGCGKSARPGL
jgi:group II intron reverse transcriptase/maturase